MVRPALAVEVQREMWVTVVWTCRASSGPHTILQKVLEHGAQQEPAAAGCPCVWLIRSALWSEASAQTPEPEESLKPSDGSALGAGPACVFPKLHYNVFSREWNQSLAFCLLTHQLHWVGPGGGVQPLCWECAWPLGL